MKRKFLPAFYVISLICALTVLKCSAQEISKPEIIAPFDSLRLSDVHASGNIKTGTVEIIMNFKNDYSQVARVYLALGGFEDFGITDSKGRKYKLHTDVNAVNTNKGYINIPFIQFGDKKFSWVAHVIQEIPYTEMRKLTIRINKLDKGTQLLTNFHIRCILSLDYGNVGDKMYSVENIRINWK
ncbi:hypothetical protein QFZ48_004079 [Chitinophaga sp. W2I13]|uniref:hypothetical protein n=1 Tax=Chitinophaga sp. W2I13 TaxID=3373923 RepID=UPI003D1FA524